MSLPAPARIISIVDGVSEVNKRSVALFVDAVWNAGRLELIEELIAADFAGRISHPQPEVLGRDGVRRLVSSSRRAFPDLHVRIQEQIAEDDLVATRWHATASTPDGQAIGAPERCPRSWSGISVSRLLAGKQVDSHTECRSEEIVRA